MLGNVREGQGQRSLGEGRSEGEEGKCGRVSSLRGEKMI